jgi:hypothetical protein
MSKVEVLIHGERQAHEEGNLRWRWKDHGRGKKGSSDGSKEAFHKKRSVPST